MKLILFLVGLVGFVAGGILTIGLYIWVFQFIATSTAAPSPADLANRIVIARFLTPVGVILALCGMGLIISAFFLPPPSGRR